MRPAMKLTILPAALAAAAFAPMPGLAHHSFAMFDPAKVVTLKGEVKEFRWVNPHVAIFVKVDGSDDPAKLWSVELTSPGNLVRRGWKRTSLKAGDKVEVQVNPLRDGRRGGGFRSVRLLDSGQQLDGALIEEEAK
jgi:hypothetical protein